MQRCWEPWWRGCPGAHHHQFICHWCRCFYWRKESNRIRQVLQATEFDIMLVMSVMIDNLLVMDYTDWDKRAFIRQGDLSAGCPEIDGTNLVLFSIHSVLFARNLGCWLLDIVPFFWRSTNIPITAIATACFRLFFQTDSIIGNYKHCHYARLKRKYWSKELSLPTSTSLRFFQCVIHVSLLIHTHMFTRARTNLYICVCMCECLSIATSEVL